MWPDNETDRDFLNFTGVAETVAEIIVQAQRAADFHRGFWRMGCRQILDDQTRSPIPDATREEG